MVHVDGNVFNDVRTRGAFVAYNIFLHGRFIILKKIAAASASQ